MSIEETIQPTPEEIYAFNVLNSTCANAQAELDRTIAARQAYLDLLEMKYQAKFDPATGTFQSTGEKPDG